MFVHVDAQEVDGWSPLHASFCGIQSHALTKTPTSKKQTEWPTPVSTSWWLTFVFWWCVRNVRRWQPLRSTSDDRHSAEFSLFAWELSRTQSQTLSAFSSFEQILSIAQHQPMSAHKQLPVLIIVCPFRLPAPSYYARTVCSPINTYSKEVRRTEQKACAVMCSFSFKV